MPYIILPLVPCPFQGVPSDWSQVPYGERVPQSQVRGTPIPGGGGRGGTPVPTHLVVSGRRTVLFFLTFISCYLKWITKIQQTRLFPFNFFFKKTQPVLHTDFQSFQVGPGLNRYSEGRTRLARKCATKMFLIFLHKSFVTDHVRSTREQEFVHGVCQFISHLAHAGGGGKRKGSVVCPWAIWPPPPN